jgi:hypothetical protein
MAVATTGLFVLFVIATRPFQRWILERRPRNLGLRMIPRWFFNLWVMKALGIIPGIMMIVAAMGLYCFFHGPDLPSAGQ